MGENIQNGVICKKNIDNARETQKTCEVMKFFQWQRNKTLLSSLDLEFKK